jgi:membrane protein implicated in regulation of membrane protease activity
MQAMRRPPETGVGELLHSMGEVVAIDGRDVRVLVHAEHWNARSRDRLRPGDRVRISGVKGMTLTVCRSDGSPDETPEREPQDGRASNALTTSR